MAVALEQFVKQLADSGVIAPGKLENFVPPKAHPKDAQELARQLVQSKHLTKFQAQEIYQGRAKSLILGNYTILDKIGAGGMGQVFKAEHRRMHRLVAIKMLPAAMTKDAAAVARFQREVEAAAKLEHPNIVTAHDADEANGVHFLVMQCIEGSDLAALVKKNGPLPIAKAVNYILQAARGLEYAHKHGVVHRDIKPANLLLNSEGTVKILDMGLARIDSDGDAATQAELTGTGAVLGTVDYMAPEQALSTRHVDGRADIYSLGCSLHYLVTAHATYGGDTLMAKLLAHREQPIPSLGAEVPEEVQAVFQQMVAKKVQDRYQSMSEVVAALEQCSPGQQTSASFQQSLSTNPDADVLTFLRDIPGHTTHKPKPKATAKPIKKATPAENDTRNRKFTLGAVSAGVLGLAILAGVLLKLRTKDGTLVVEVNQPDAVVQVLDADGKVEISQPGGKGSISISVDPGNHRLKVEKDGFKFFAKDFEMDSGGTQSITATLEPVNAVAGQPDKPWNRLAFQRWVKTVAALPAERQVEAVSKKLQEFNPGFNGIVKGWGGALTPKIDNGVVTELSFFTDNVTDISPVRALPGLKSLGCDGSATGRGKVSDLSPLEGMRLVKLSCASNKISSLAPVGKMPLAFLNCGDTSVWDLAPLAGMPLTELWCGYNHRVSDLSPLKGMRLVDLTCPGTRVTDLSPLEGMPITHLNCGNTWISNLSPLLEMPLKFLGCENTLVSDLSPLKGMRLEVLMCNGIKASDLSPLAGMHLTEVYLTPKRSTKGMDVIRQMKGMKTIGLGWDKERFPPDQFWEKYDAGEFWKPISTFNDPAFKKWMKDVAALPGGGQAEAVAQKLQELNPGFDGKVTPKIEGNVVTELQFLTDNVTDISPVRALVGLKSLSCGGVSWSGNGKLSDLSPLRGVPLTSLSIASTQVSDLSPLQRMPLAYLNCSFSQIADLSPLEGMPLANLDCHSTLASDLSPLKGMHLKLLYVGDTRVSDLSPLQEMPLTNLNFDDSLVFDLTPLQGMSLTGVLFTPKNITKGINIFRQMKSLQRIGLGWQENEQFPPAEFWKKYDAGEFGKPDSSAPNSDRKPITDINNPAFRQWMKTVAALPAEQQVEVVAKKLKDLNPGFDGMETHKIEGGVVMELDFLSDRVTDISPVRAVPGLKTLRCICSIWDASKRLTTLSDLSPLQGMKLTALDLRCTNVSDLSPLQGMRLTEFGCQATPVSNLSPLTGMPLTILWCQDTRVSDLSPLKGMPLTTLFCSDTQVSDLSPLKGMPLTTFGCFYTQVSDLSALRGMDLTEIAVTPKNIAKGIDEIRQMKSLKTVGIDASNKYPAAVFWKKYDLGDFK